MLRRQGRRLRVRLVKSFRFAPFPRYTPPHLPAPQWVAKTLKQAGMLSENTMNIFPIFQFFKNKVLIFFCFLI
jgi:hypothetical protein